MDHRFFEINEVLGELYPEHEDFQPIPEYLAEAGLYAISALMEELDPPSAFS